METLSNYDPAEDNAVVRELLLGENGVCFLCCKQPNNSDNKNGRVNRLNVSLRSICRYLRMDTNSILTKVLGSNCPPELYSCDLTVVLCEKCGKITNQLSQFLRQIEVLQMLVDYNMQEFYGILESNRDNGIRQGNAEADTEETVAEGKILELLRLETRKTCGALLKRRSTERHPVVKLERLKETDIPISKGKFCPTPSVCTDDPVPINLNAVNTKTYSANKLIPGNNKSVKMLTDFSKIASSITLKKSTTRKETSEYPYWVPKAIHACFTKLSTLKTPSSKLHCRYCSKMPVVRYAKWHVVSQHPEKLFYPRKLDGVTEEQFKICCHKVFQDEIQKTAKVGLQEHRCKYCLWQGIHYPAHLVTRHFSMLVRKLKESQVSKDWEIPITNIRNELSTKVTNGNKLACNLCKKLICPTSFATKLHLINSHPEKLLSSGKLENVSEVQFETCCRHLFQVQLKNAVKTGKLEWNCAHCSWNGQDYKKHLFKSHISLLESILKQYQQEKIWTKQSLAERQSSQMEHNNQVNLLVPSLKSKGNALSNVRATGSKAGGSNTKSRQMEAGTLITQAMKSLYKREVGKNYQKEPTAYCPICKIEVKNAKAHLFTQHLEECFPGKILEGLSRMEFKTCCALALNTALNQAKIGNKNGERGTELLLKCSYCKFRTYKVSLFRTHVIENHYKVLEQMLMGEQRKCRLMQDVFNESEQRKDTENSEKPDTQKQSRVPTTTQSISTLTTSSKPSVLLAHQFLNKDNSMKQDQQKSSKKSRKRKNCEKVEKSEKLIPKKKQKVCKTFTTISQEANQDSSANVSALPAVVQTGNKGIEKVNSFHLPWRHSYSDVTSSMLATGNLINLDGSKKTNLQIINAYSIQNNHIYHPVRDEDSMRNQSLVQMEVYGEEIQDAIHVSNEAELKEPAVGNGTLPKLSNASEQMTVTFYPLNDQDNTNIVFHDELPGYVGFKTEVISTEQL